MAMSDYAAMKKELPKMKAALTKAKNRKAWSTVIALCNEAFARFDQIGWPDNWSHWQRSRDDAEFEIQRARLGF